MIKTRRLTLSQINSATKYPSIETFHKLGESGMLTEELNFNDRSFIAKARFEDYESMFKRRGS